MTKAIVKGDKFERTIEVMATGAATANRLIAAGYDGTYYIAKRASKRGGNEFVSMVMRNAKTGEYEFAI